MSLLLAVIYLAFISLGLPDSLLGASWPVMRQEMDLPLSYAGIITMIISIGTIISSLQSQRLIRKMGTGWIVVLSVLMTGLSLLGFSYSRSFLPLCILAVPYGLGAGAIDAALNNYVALHYSSRHMSWLHCFWGVGAAVGPSIMGYALTAGAGWQGGYRIVSIIQLVLTILLFAGLPLWRDPRIASPEHKEAHVLSLRQILNISGAKKILLAFFAYCGLESTAGLWASSYLVNQGVTADVAAAYASLFYLGITVGRFLCGFVADKVGDQNMIRIGIATLTAGIVAVGFPGIPEQATLAGLVIIGFGCAPIYPSIIHATPMNFGPENSQALVGVQMACAYTGSTLLPPLFGVLANQTSIVLYPVYLLLLSILMYAMTESLNRGRLSPANA